MNAHREREAMVTHCGSAKSSRDAPAAGKRFYFVSILGYGDALISLQLLQQIRHDPAPLTLVGTAVTRNIMRNVTGFEFPLIELFPDHAAFFRVRTAALSHCLQDLFAFNAWALRNLSSADTVIFEKPDIRNRIVLGLSRARCVAPDATDSIYMDRKRLIEGIFDQPMALRDCAVPSVNARYVLINPSARYSYKQLPRPLVSSLVAVLRALGLTISLVDPKGEYEGLRATVDNYYGNLTLANATVLLRAQDLYIGPDSFFVHLAYYLGVPFMAIGPALDAYFAPPGAYHIGNYVTMQGIEDIDSLRAAIGRFLAGHTPNT